VHQILSSVSKSVPYNELFVEWFNVMFWKILLYFHLTFYISVYTF
jgi:hypothetical protein